MRIRTGIVAISLFALGVGPAGISAEEGPPDAWLTTKAKVNILTNVGTAGAINVDTVDGVLTLHGTVPTKEDKKRAEDAAREIEGVKQVRNLLQVVPPKKQEKVAAKDGEIKGRVTSALKQEKALEKDDIYVQSVNQGVVLLAGKAQDQLGHLRAVEIARNVDGVESVSSEVKVRDEADNAEVWKRIERAGVKQDEKGFGQRMAEGVSDAAGTVSGATKDAWITSAVKTRLLANEKTPGMDINVDTENGVVKLLGAVPSREAKQEAENQARKVSGVERVENELVVTPTDETASAGTE